MDTQTQIVLAVVLILVIILLLGIYILLRVNRKRRMQAEEYEQQQAMLQVPQPVQEVQIQKKGLFKRHKEGRIPQDVLDNFNKAEQMLRDSKGTMTPEEVLWKMYQERNAIIIPKENTESIPKYTQPKVNLRDLFRRR